MNINVKQLEINVNLHSLQPDFLNYELHYIIASGENTFRFVNWDKEPKTGEQKFYCFLVEQELFIPAGNILLKESYVLKEEPIYPFVSNYIDFVSAIEAVQKTGVAKFIRRFSDNEIDTIKNGLEKKFDAIGEHIVTSSQGQHLLMITEDIEISISATMVHFRRKAEFSESHYHNVKEE